MERTERVFITGVLVFSGLWLISHNIATEGTLKTTAVNSNELSTCTARGSTEYARNQVEPVVLSYPAYYTKM